MLLQYKNISSYFTIICVALMALTISSCGLKPIYGQQDRVTATELSVIKVSQVEKGRDADASTDKRSGQILQNAIEDLLNPTSDDTDKKYNLKFSFKKKITPLSIEQDAEITLYNIIVTTDFSLVEIATGKEIYADTSTITASFKTVTSDFANYTVEEDTLQRILKESAQDVRMKVASYFLSK